VLVESQALAQLNGVPFPVAGFDMSSLGAIGARRTRAVRLGEHKHTMLTEPRVVLRLRLDGPSAPAPSGMSEVELRVRQSGTSHAVVSWFTLHLDENTSLSTAPGCGGLMRGHSWGQLATYLQRPGHGPDTTYDLG
jgi:hypothetical protein